MKEDILEQLVDDYLQHKGYFTRHNIKFRPRSNHPSFDKKKDSNHSDIDVVGINPNLRGSNRIWAVSCKSWQGGFNCESKMTELRENKIISGREAWKGFRELISPKWSSAFISEIEKITGSRKFTYVTAVTVLRGDSQKWENYKPFIKAMEGNPIRIVTLNEILDEVYKELKELGTTLASTEVGRFLQVIKASKWVQQKKA